MTEREKREAISDGVYAWLSDHPVSFYDALSNGAERGVSKWLDANIDEEVWDRIAKKIAERVDDWRPDSDTEQPSLSEPPP